MKLTPEEKSLRDRFERALFGDDPTRVLLNLTVDHPTTLLAMAEAYRWEGRFKRNELMSRTRQKATLKSQHAAELPYKVMMYTLIMIWLATRGHEGAKAILATTRKMPPPPPLPQNWWYYKDEVYRKMGQELDHRSNVRELRARA